jgi:hypothetical protein
MARDPGSVGAAADNASAAALASSSVAAVMEANGGEGAAPAAAAALFAQLQSNQVGLLQPKVSHADAAEYLAAVRSIATTMPRASLAAALDYVLFPVNQVRS